MKHIYTFILFAALISMCGKDDIPTPPELNNLEVSMETSNVTLPYGVPTILTFSYKNAAGGLSVSFPNLPGDIAADTGIASSSGKITLVSSIDDDRHFNIAIVFSDGKSEVSKQLKLRTVKKEEQKPVVLSFSTQNITIHEASVNRSATLDFTLENSTPDTQVTVAQVEGLSTSATLNSDLKGGVLTIMATSEFTSGCKLAVTASNATGSDVKEITVDKYYLSLSSGNENIVIDNALRTISCTTYKEIKDVQLNVSTNFSTSVTPVDNGWLKVTNRLLLSAGWNDKQETRSATLTIKANPGNLEYSYTVSQVAGVDELDLERQSLIELWKALDGPNWIDRGSLGNCWAHNWNTDAPVEDWYGVLLYNKYEKYPGHVKAILLSDQRARGELPECIENFRYLDEFEINGINGAPHLKGKVPKAFGKLPLLRKFDIGFNEFEEDLETSAVKDIMLNCPRIEYLGIDNNNFTGRLPEWLAELKETHHESGNRGRYDIDFNRLEGKVPEKVKNHWQWQRPWLMNSDYKTWGEYFMKNQQPGYKLYE